ncbi:hypothetical protein E7T06_15920 [Deinococcus sp. Arct2-2]|uniref:hypothetical protein n=1 Tax=Deinococcus sp. Arct2-2 TaxID=2568653 RepID=UPI0010A59151|nr:hypothetical protein [Deinococcus sp. Arct2-2]THF68584.1 hypothetical protein E7T06_15920 [Deinococcus sp. Arct2-2]
MKRARLALGLTAALLTLTTAQASTFTPLTLTQQAKKAQVIVRATVGSPTATQTGSGPTAVSWINYPLTVTEIIAGDVASLPLREGKPTLMFLAGLQDVPTLNSGQDVFLLLYTGTQDSPLVGFNQGVYPVINGRVTLWNEAAIEAETPTAAATARAAASTATAAAATASTTTSAGASASATAATAPPVDGATAAANNPVTPSPTPTTGPVAPSATTGTTTPPAGSTATAAAPVNPATASSTAAAATPSLTATPPQTAAPAAPVTPAATPDPFERDPAKFRDQLRAARNSP